MIKKIFSLCMFVSCFCLSVLSYAQEWKKISDVPQEEWAHNYLYKHQGQLIAVLSSGRIVLWSEKNKKWEPFGENTQPQSADKKIKKEKPTSQIPALVNMVYSEGPSLYAATENGIYLYDAKTKSWDLHGNLSKGLMSRGLSKSNGKLTTYTPYGFYSLDEKKTWKKINSKTPEPSSYGFWGMSPNYLVTSGEDETVYAYDQKASSWINITANLKNEISTQNRVEDLTVIDDTFYVGLKGKGIFERKLNDAAWSLMNQGIDFSKEEFVAFPVPLEPLKVLTTKDQYVWDNQLKAWKSLQYSFGEKSIKSIVELGGIVYANSSNQIFRKKDQKIDLLQAGLNKSRSFYDLAKIGDQFLVSHRKGLWQFSPGSEEWKSLSDEFSPDCTQDVYPILKDQNQFWIGTGTGGVYHGVLGGKIEALNEGLKGENTRFKSPPCPAKMYDVVADLSRFGNTFFALTRAKLYERSTDTWNESLNFNPIEKSSKKKSEQVPNNFPSDRACCMAQNNDSLFVASERKLYQYRGSKKWTLLNLPEHISSKYILSIAVNSQTLALLTSNKDIYFYNLKEKTWNFIPSELNSLSRIVVLNDEFYALGSSSLYRWDTKIKDWVNFKAPKVALDVETNNSEKTFYFDLISEGHKLYLLSNEGLFETNLKNE